ncbi:LacI family DNA-binding transcriptional regulator [Candidatus Poriferisodalis sp.]|uniref:LacI family DNA-binding transcriptional regulator n=1 Tax=Candidatus Poriferisodalis sp. TaxID=3101277 RepID=UPI003B5C91F6
MTSVTPTIYDVAQAAGVSISTVSNALNRPDRVSEETRARVLECIDRLGFVPKSQATNLARKQMRRIGVIAPFTSYVSYMTRLAGVLAEARAAGFEVATFDSESAATSMTPILDSLPIKGQVDGLIVMGFTLDSTIEDRLKDRGVPLVVVDAISTRFPVITCDDEQSGRVGAAHLLDLGHRSFGYVRERQRGSYESQADRRLSGFTAELDKTPGTQLRVVECDPTFESARAAAHSLISSDDRPTAVMAHFDELAVGVLKAAADLGVRIPDELSVIGVDDGPVAEATDLTTVRQPFSESGVEAVRLLISRLDRPSSERTVTFLDLRVVERGTTAPVEPANSVEG